MPAPIGVAELSAFAVYLVLLALISLAAWRQTRSLDDYALGGRRLGPTVAALSAGASDMSGWLLLGLPGAVYLAGLSEAWIVVGLVIGAYLNWTLVAPRLRTMTRGKLGARTLPQLFAQRFPARSRLLAAVATAMVLVFFSLYTAAGFVAGAKLFEATLAIDYHSALLIGAAVIMAYTAAGGFLAVSWTDVLQGLLMMAALVCVPLLVGADLDAQTGQLTDQLDTHLLLLDGMGALGITSLLAWGLGYCGQPHILARFMAMSEQASMSRARAIGMSWMITSCAGALAVGLAGFAYAQLHGGPTDAEVIFIHLTQAMLSPWLAGFVLAAILAAVMSTIDSQLLVASTALTDDVIRPFRPATSDRTLMQLSRAAVVLVAGLGVWIAANPERGVLDLVSSAWAGLGATFGPALLATLYLRQANSTAIIAGMLVGGGAVIIWPLATGPWFEVYELLPAFVASCATIVLVSRFGNTEACAVAAFDRLSAARPSTSSSRSG
ncbi:MAG: sodium/proline symporter PutP [Gammaproteobacteria bacterium]|nr:sodium/proline symporter PutP [Gammaproteobacteria bacterium]